MTRPALRLRFVPLLLPLVALGTIAEPASAQPRSPIFAAKSLRCFEGRGYSADWNGGVPRLEAATFPSKGESIQFDGIDQKAGRARIVGNAGAGGVTVLVTAAGLHFIEETPSGNLNVTTVFAARPRELASGMFVYVTSRHVDLGFAADAGVPLPSQFHGVCKVSQ